MEMNSEMWDEQWDEEGLKMYQAKSLSSQYSAKDSKHLFDWGSTVLCTDKIFCYYRANKVSHLSSDTRQLKTDQDKLGHNGFCS